MLSLADTEEHVKYFRLYINKIEKCLQFQGVAF